MKFKHIEPKFWKVSFLTFIVIVLLSAFVMADLLALFIGFIDKFKGTVEDRLFLLIMMFFKLVADVGIYAV